MFLKSNVVATVTRWRISIVLEIRETPVILLLKWYLNGVYIGVLYLFPAIHVQVAFWLIDASPVCKALWPVLSAQNIFVEWNWTNYIGLWLHWLYKLGQRKLPNFDRAQGSRRIDVPSCRQLFKCVKHFKRYINYKARNIQAMKFTFIKRKYGEHFSLIFRNQKSLRVSITHTLKI